MKIAIYSPIFMYIDVECRVGLPKRGEKNIRRDLAERARDSIAIGHTGVINCIAIDYNCGFLVELVHQLLPSI